MAWTCPICKRPFKNVNQSHSCVQVDPDSIFENSSAQARKLYKKLISSIKQFGPFDITAAKQAVFLKHPSSFISIRPKKEAVELEFLLNEEIKDFPIYKTLRLSKNRVAHYVKLDNPAQIDKQLLSWLRQSYQQNSKP